MRFYLAPNGPLKRTILIGVTLRSHKYRAQLGIRLAGGCGGLEVGDCGTSCFIAASPDAGLACMAALNSEASLLTTCCGVAPSSAGCGPSSGGRSAIPAKKYCIRLMHNSRAFYHTWRDQNKFFYTLGIFKRIACNKVTSHRMTH